MTEFPMRPSYDRDCLWRRVLLTGLLCVVVTGCTVVGPSAVRNGRMAYNEAITETNNQQMLMAVVRNRYDETGNLLAVASVTANVSVTASTGIELGFGDSDTYDGNLVPFSAGAVYEENPTISYVPVAGAKYAKQLFSPVSVAVLAELTGSLVDPGYVYTALVAGANGLRNPDFLHASVAPDPRFERFVFLMTALTQAHRLHWVGGAGPDGGFSIVVDQYAPAFAAEVGELLSLLGLPVPDDQDSPVVVPVSLALDGREAGGLGLITRSVADLVEILSAAIDVPEDDRRRGVAAAYPPAGLAGRNLRVRYGDDTPAGATVAVPYRDGWYFIDETDGETKRFFRLLSALWSVSMAEGTAHAATPVLTVPVSR
jgi:hypothetical protein